MKSFMPHLGLGTEIRSHFDRTKLLPVPPGAYLNLSKWHMVNFSQTPKAVRETKDLLQSALEPEKILRLLKVQKEKLGYALLQKIEAAKIDLTDNDRVKTELEDLGLDFVVSTTRKKFNTYIAGHINRISSSIDECLSQAGISANRINLVILTGGSSELPIITDIIHKKFPDAKLSRENKFSSVGLGLAYSTAKN